MCPAYEEIRKGYIRSKFLLNKNEISFNTLMTTQNIDDMRNLTNYLRTAFQRGENILSVNAIAIEHLP